MRFSFKHSGLCWDFMADVQKIKQFAHGFRTFYTGRRAFNWIRVIGYIKKGECFVKSIIFWTENLNQHVLQGKVKSTHKHQQSHKHVLTCGLLRGPKFMLGVDGSDTDGEPRDEVMTEYGEARPFIGEPKVVMGDRSGLEVLMTDGWPAMPPMWAGWAWVALIGPEESRQGKSSSL